MSKAIIIGIGALALGALALGGSAKASGPPNNVVSRIDGQPYFNGLSSSKQGAVIAGLWGWYNRNKGTGNWPSFVGDPKLTSQSQLYDAGNFGILVDALQTSINNSSGNVPPDSAAGVLDAHYAAALGVMT